MMREKYSLYELIRVGVRRLLYLSCLFFLRIRNLFRPFNKNVVLINSSISPLSKNWGDDVSTQIVKCINPALKVVPYRYVWNLNHKINYLCIGSIVSWMSTETSIIWGSGCIYPEKKISAKPLKVLAVRGPLTRDYLLKEGVDCPEIYGDPALLFPRYYKSQVQKKFKLGVIPHFRDKQHPILQSIVSSDSRIQIIDVQDVRDWRSFIDRINECECICSSSLHGIIVSDAYRVPNIWVEFNGGERKSFAFQDYYLSVNKKESAVPLQLDRPVNVEEILAKCKNWKAPQIDLEKLMSVCPFIR